MIETMDNNYEWVRQFAGLPVVSYEPGMPLDDPAHTAYALRVAYDEQVSWSEKLSALLAQEGSDQIAGLVVGTWANQFVGHTNGSEGVVAELAAVRDQLPTLKALFLGDIVQEECEISWLRQSDVSPLLLAYPWLEHFCVRGAEDLSFGEIRHPSLRSLVVQCGGLPRAVLAEIANADLPVLEHLELWLGEENYGWDGSVGDLAPILDGSRFPGLRYLGLRDSEIADQIAVAVAQAPILERLEVLDLSLGTLGDDGALALLKSPGIRGLTKLDIHRHYCSKAMVAQLRQLGIAVDASGREEPDSSGDEELRYVAVGE